MRPPSDLLVSFTVPGRPVPKGRPRFAKGRTYTDEATVAYEEAVAKIARHAMKCRPAIADPVGVAVIFEQRDGRLSDLDNLIKSLLDGMSSKRASKTHMGRIGPVLVNDSQVVEIRASLVRKADHDRATVAVHTPTGASA